MNKLILLACLLICSYALPAISLISYTVNDTTHVFVNIPFEQFIFSAENGSANYLLSIGIKDSGKKTVVQSVIPVNLLQKDVITGAAYLKELVIPTTPGSYKLTYSFRNTELGDKKDGVLDFRVDGNKYDTKNILIADNSKFLFSPSSYSQLSASLKGCYVILNTSASYDSIKVHYVIDSISYQVIVPKGIAKRFDLMKILREGTLSSFEVLYYSGNIVENIQWSLFQSGNNYTQMFSLKDQLQQIRYIASQNEWKSLRKVDKDLAVAIESFWDRHNINPGSNKNELREMFYGRVLKAEELFTIHKKLRGWKSDRGRIYIQYGPPDDIIEDSYYVQGYPDIRSYPRIIWYYYKADRTFNFVDKTGYGNYQILDEYYED